MEQTIKINVPEGKVAKYNETTQTIEFVDKEQVKSKSWEEFSENHPFQKTEWYVSTYGKIEGMLYIPNEAKRTNVYSNALETKEDAEGILALIQLTRLHDEWVGDWKPDWTKYIGDKFVIGYRKNELFIGVTMDGYKLLSFPTAKMAFEFVDCFKDLLEKAKKFI